MRKLFFYYSIVIWLCGDGGGITISLSFYLLSFSRFLCFSAIYFASFYACVRSVISSKNIRNVFVCILHAVPCSPLTSHKQHYIIQINVYLFIVSVGFFGYIRTLNRIFIHDFLLFKLCFSICC